MTLTGFWNRIDAWVSSLDSRDEVAWAHQEMNERLEHYDEAVNLHLWRGGHINSSHDWAFRFVVSQSLKEIEQVLDMMNILEHSLMRPAA